MHWIIFSTILLVGGIVILLMGQHGKNRLAMDPEEYDRQTTILAKPDSPAKERNRAKKKRNKHEKANDSRKNRQSNDKPTK